MMKDLRVRITSFVERHVAILLIVMMFLGLGATLLNQQHTQKQLIRQIAVHHAKAYSTILEQFRTLYTSEVVERVRSMGVEVRHDYTNKEGAIPLPATFTMLLGSSLIPNQVAGASRLYSAYPFPWREKEGGLSDDFSRAAWASLTQDPESSFFRFEEDEHGSMLRYATADRMRGSCVNCHNSHADTPKNDWKVGDVRGVLEVTVPLERHSQAAMALQQQHVPLLLVLTILGGCGIFLLIAVLRKHSVEREGLVQRDSYAKQLESEAKRRKLVEVAVEHLDEMVMITDIDGKISYANPAVVRITGYPLEELIGNTTRILNSGRQAQDFYRDMWQTILAGKVWTDYVVNRKKDATLFEEILTISPVRDSLGSIVNFVAVGLDATKERALQIQLKQAQKLEAIGQLAAGIAHEINTPTQYVGDNTRFLNESFLKLLQLHEEYGMLLEAVKSGTADAALVEKIETKRDEADLDFLFQEIPKAICESLEGIDRVTQIVRAMKDFSHPGSDGKKNTDINNALESTISVSRNEWKYVAEVITDFDALLPELPCYPAELNQVFLNLIVNAAHAIGGTDKQDQCEKGVIEIGTQCQGNYVEVRIADSGSGIPEEIRDRIFDPFFTTKEVGKGTGQGLAIVHSVVVEQHGGTIRVDSEPGRGTTFIIRLPIEVAASEVKTISPSSDLGLGLGLNNGDPV